ncbi:hypothetical protein NU090_004140 [Salmonella enterica]|uniref:hypothetical protein n=1 Tax=Salmonella enterica TaxID=28901 RepID=UPI0011193EF5|nr:hypothetical protein [Salmonella enterica]EDF8370622.1 hypothetical protein [Salmonella enterica subsp. enterica serovar Panama]HCM1908528.1 hypothetical protein [Salmonella enterica subsp. arizonae serovar 48:z4,z24:-]EFV4428111.1 hypothetical protein [Salmonella enterica]EGH4700010.1 hypothetical protein [Salmonella enterica]EHA1940577.1 hypothetical protein [Salmonella enterica]
MKIPNFIMLASILATFSSSTLAATPLTIDQKSYIKSVLNKQLLDPESAKYQFPDYLEKNPTYCFKLNAKNPYGGYTGYRWVQIAHDSIKQNSPDAVVDISVLPKEVFEESCKEIGYK